jgi:adsorption protein B
VVAIREYFPSTRRDAIHQKARWMRGIALSGWDRLGWSGGLAERWMRMRDRQALVAALVLAAGYLAFLLWILREAATSEGLPPLTLSPVTHVMLRVNLLLFLWRMAMRFGFVSHDYGWREGLRSIPRVFVGNIISLFAASRALVLYGGGRRAAKWDKTRHHFPAELPAE